jgi:hypothetical protein
MGMDADLVRARGDLRLAVLGLAGATMKSKRLHVEVNRDFAEAETAIRAGNSTVMVTPPLDEEYFIARVVMHRDQAIVVFPKFGVIGCGFAKEKDWNTNLPITCDAAEIWRHIKHNRKYRSITDKRGLLAITMLQNWCAELSTKGR